MIRPDPLSTRARADDDEDDDDEPGAPDAKLDMAMFGLQRSLLKQRTILVSRPVSAELSASVIGQLLVLDGEDPTKPITVYVNSPGGDADSGFAIYDAMRFVRAPVFTVCSGLAASAAVLIYLGGDESRRYALRHSRFLIHQPSMMGSQGSASDLEITANEIERTRDTYNEIIAANTGKTAKQVEKDAHRDFWLNAQEAVDYGLVSRIVESADELG